MTQEDSRPLTSAVTALIAQIRSNIAAADDAAAFMVFNTRVAHDREGWDAAVEALVKTETPTVLDGVRYDSTSKAADAMDRAAHAVWDGVRDLLEPAIEGDAEATADEAIEGRSDGKHPDRYLHTLRWWQSACHPWEDAYPTPLERITAREHFRDASAAYMSRVVQDGIHYLTQAEILKGRLDAAHHRALTWPFGGLDDSDVSGEH